MQKSSENPSPLAAPESTDPSSCPRCGFHTRDDEWITGPSSKLAVCLNCGELMAFDTKLDDAFQRYEKIGGRRPEQTPGPVVPTAVDFARLTPDSCAKLMKASSLTYRAAQLRGYHLGKLRFRAGNA
jgi:hypothetical protein